MSVPCTQNVYSLHRFRMLKTVLLIFSICIIYISMFKWFNQQQSFNAITL